jgi:chemotaxis protein histidine kinase CheA
MRGILKGYALMTDPATAIDLVSALATDVMLTDWSAPEFLSARLADALPALSGTAAEPGIRQAIRLLADGGDPDVLQGAVANALDAAAGALLVADLTPVEDGEKYRARDEFLARSLDALADLAALTEQLGEGADVRDDLRRGVHTLKGEAGALDLRGPAQAMHALEDALAGDQAVPMARAILDWCGERFEAIRLGDESEGDVATFLASLHGEHITPELAQHSAGGASTVHGSAAGGATMRIGIERLDTLHDAVGELVVVHTMLAGARELAGIKDRRIRALFATLERTTTAVQQLTTRLRLVPLRGLLQRTARIARETARHLGRPVDVHLVGEDEEADRAVVERLADPLVHLVRNAIDHGLEGLDERVRAGKEPSGNLTIAVRTTLGSLTVTVSDDGRGLDPQRIVARARANGLIAPEANPEGEAVHDLLFLRGFSTAAEVTQISGRGVGLDVVKTAVTALRGVIDVTSQPGQGCSFIIRLPTSLAVIDGLAVMAGGQRLVLPTTAVAGTVRLDPQLFVGRQHHLITVQGRQVPVVHLAHVLGYAATDGAPSPRPLAVIVESGERRLALAIDAVLGRQQVVLKELSRGIPAPPGIGGAAIAADGRPMLVVDIPALLRH